MREFSPLAIFLGIVIGIVFGAANAYIGLKVGMTVSASIPAAVISMGILRALLKRGTILENNMVQTIGSVGESLAAGMIFVIPALFIFAVAEHKPDMAPNFWEIAVWGGLGGLLGVLFMVPLRRMLIVKEHGKLPFPEGTACAEVLESGDRGGKAAKTVFAGLGVGALFELVRGLGFFRDVATQRLPLLRTAAGLDTSPALLGVGYILGIRVAGYMLGGAVLGWFVIIPAIAFFGASNPDVIFPAADRIAEMAPDDIWGKYVRYIGAGAVVFGGIISLLRSLGTIGGSVFHLFGGRGSSERTDRDIPTFVLLLLVIGLGAAMWYLPGVKIAGPDGPATVPLLHELFKHIPVIACVIGFGFFFVTVSSRLVGIVGSSSNPASGMTIATILGTALIIVALSQTMGLDATAQKVAIIAVGSLVCIAICIAGDTSQDLKTGYLVKATPWKQQIGELIGVLTATVALAGVIWLIKGQYGFSETVDTPNPVPAYQANLMKMVVQGVVDQQLPWNFIFIGMAAALIVEMLGLPALPFAVGLYLPLNLSMPIMAGGVIRWAIDRIHRGRKSSEAQDPGILASSGLVAGHGVMGVVLVGVTALIGWWWADPYFAEPKYYEPAKAWVAFDKTHDTWVHQDGDQPTAYFDDVTEDWVVGTPPVPETQPAAAGEGASHAVRPKGERVWPKHLMPWLSTRVGFLDMEYGLRQLQWEQALPEDPAEAAKIDPETVFRGKYAIDWFKLLPLGPFALMALWLFIVALRRPPEVSVSVAGAAPTPLGPAAHPDYTPPAEPAVPSGSPPAEPAPLGGRVAPDSGHSAGGHQTDPDGRTRRAASKRVAAATAGARCGKEINLLIRTDAG